MPSSPDMRWDLKWTGIGAVMLGILDIAATFFLLPGEQPFFIVRGAAWIVAGAILIWGEL